MAKDTDDISTLLSHSSADQAIINEVFIEGFHALYKIQIGNSKTATLFDTDTSINFSAPCNSSLKLYQPIEKLFPQMVTARSHWKGPYKIPDW